MNQVTELANMRKIIKEFRYIPVHEIVRNPIRSSSAVDSIFHDLQGIFGDRNIVNQFWKPLEEGLLHTPVFDIAVIPFKYRADPICIRLAVVDVGIFEREGPVELVVTTEMGPEIARGKVTVVIVDEALAEGRPGNG
jgi:hypothetical protein